VGICIEPGLATASVSTMRNCSNPLLTFFPGAQFIKSFISNGVLQDHSVLQKRLRAILGADVTFADAYKKTGAFRVCQLFIGTHS